MKMKKVKQTKQKENFVTCIVGTNRSGKLTLAKQRAKAWKKENKTGKVLAFDPTDNFITCGFVDEIIKYKNWAKFLCEQNKDGSYKYANSLLGLNTYRMLNPSEKLDEQFQNLLHNTGAINMDIIVTVHSPKFIHLRLSHFITDYCMLPTLDLDQFDDNQYQPENLNNIKEIINRYQGIANPEGKKKFYPKFPHINYNTKNSTVEYINMKTPILLQSLTDCLIQK